MELEPNQADIETVQPDPWWKGPIKYILGLMLILLLVLWYFPSQAVKLDPEPYYIPKINEVAPSNISIDSKKIEINSYSDYLKFVSPNDPVIKQAADKIVALSCKGSNICYAKAIYYFIRDDFQYVSDPYLYEYVKTARESLVSKVGDCDDASVLAANLLEAVGIRARFVFIPGHVFVQAYLPDALKHYKTEDDYVALDLTCKGCKFGELPYSDFTKNMQIVG